MFGHGTRGEVCHHGPDAPRVVQPGTATAADDVQFAPGGRPPEGRSHFLGGLVVAAEGVGQTGIGIAVDAGVCNFRQPTYVRQHVHGAQRTVDPNRKGFRMADGMPEGFRRLARQVAAAGIHHTDGNHDRERMPRVPKQPLDGEERSLGVERVEHRLDQQEIGSAIHKAPCLLAVGRLQCLEGRVAKGWIRDIRRQGSRHVGGADRPCHEARAVRLRVVAGVHGLPPNAGGGHIQFIGQVGEAKVRQGNAGGRKGVGGYDVRPGIQVLPVDVPNDPGLGQAQQVVAAHDGRHMVPEPVAGVVRGGQPLFLKQRAHGTVQDQDALGGGLHQVGR